MDSAEQARDRYGLLSVEVPVLLLALGTLVLRIRATEELAENPLDPAGLFRIGCVGAALLLALMSLLTPSRAPDSRSLLRSRLFRLYAVYVFVVLVGAPLSEQPVLTAYRGIELSIAMVVFVAAYRRVGSAAVARIQTILYWFAFAMVGSVWVGVVASPELAVREVSVGFENVTTPIPWQIEGVFPTISANLVGALSAVLVFWTIGRMITEREVFSARVGAAITAFAFVTLIAAQYRTGYVAALLTAFVAVVLLRKKAIATFVVGIAVVAFVTGSVSLAPAEDFVLKGQDVQTTSATTLTGRLEWWESALPIWRDSPVIGKGLLTATRFEVLAAAGNETGSTIHSTWVEALLGTGVIGVALLLLCLLVAWKRALVIALRDKSNIIPPLLLGVITVRGLTGSTFEIFSYMGLLFFFVLISIESSAEEEALPEAARL